MNHSQISSIDESVTNCMDSLPEAIRALKFTDAITFNIEQADELINYNELQFPGVYYLEISNSDRTADFKTWSDDFLEKWHHEDYLRKFTPNSRKMRLKAHRDATNFEWVPLYLGKSRNIGNRVHQHIHLGLEKPTFALKLKARTNVHDLKFRLSFIKIDVKNYNVIMPLVESQLRNRFNPILGRQ
jgi:hypothetical protein